MEFGPISVEGMGQYSKVLDLLAKPAMANLNRNCSLNLIAIVEEVKKLRTLVTEIHRLSLYKLYASWKALFLLAVFFLGLRGLGS